MLKRFFSGFKKKEEPAKGEDILLSKIDKHMNFILRDSMGSLNKSISEKIIGVNQKKENTILALRTLHKAKLMNASIPEREFQIMDGNRDNYIKRITSFVSDVEISKNYLEAYDYCVKFSETLEHLGREIQKNIFVLQHFFANEVRDSNKALHDLEEAIIDIRVLLEKNGIQYLKDIQKDMKIFVDNVLKIKNFNDQTSTERIDIKEHQDKIDRLTEKIKTITTGTEYRALEGFKQEKADAEDELKKVVDSVRARFTILESALKKYYYLNPDRKIIKEYLEDMKSAIIDDKDLEIVQILSNIKDAINEESIDLKDKKKEHCLEAIESLTSEYLKMSQTDILKLEEQKARAQTKITHNSASLNLSEQQYWIDATRDKIRYHESNIDKLKKNINNVDLENSAILMKIREDLEKLMNKKIELVDDLTQGLLRGDDMLSDQE